MPVRNALVIAVDGLRASALGAYGNAWHPTPALDALASRSLVLDWMFCERPTLEGFYEAAWRTTGGSLVGQLTAAGLQAALVTDAAAVAARGESCGFAEIRRIEFTAAASAPSVAETELAQVFAVAADVLESWTAAPAANGDQPPPSRLLWLHARGFHGAWDAPLPLRASLLEEDDPPAPTFTAPPSAPHALDHDELLLYRAAYAAQTMVLDECVEALLAALLDAGLDDSTLVILVGVRGYALGEHRAVGDAATTCYGEVLHVPGLVYRPGAAGPPPRSPRLTTASDLPATLLDWFAVSDAAPLPDATSWLADDPSPPRTCVISAVQGERAIRTPAWMLRDRGDSAPSELYRKPDDRWEANEIADRCPEIAARLQAALAAELASPSLDDDLVAHPS